MLLLTVVAAAMGVVISMEAVTFMGVVTSMAVFTVTDATFFTVVSLARVSHFMDMGIRGGVGIIRIIPTRTMETKPMTAVRTATTILG